MTAHFFGNNHKNGEKNTHRDQSSTAQILLQGRMFNSIPRKICFGVTLEWNETRKIGEIQVKDSPAGLYDIQGNAWMNSVIWNDPMLRYYKFLVAQNRKILLVVDNFAGHKTVDKT